MALPYSKEDGTPCDDSKWCTVNDVCTGGICGGAPRDCSENNILGIATCSNDPDNISMTWDFRAAFTSVCNETADKCTTGNETITNTCDKTKCLAECVTNTDCAPRCDGNVLSYGGTCGTENKCECSYTTVVDCDLQDNWYNTTDAPRWVELDQCNLKEQIYTVYRDYSCAIKGCNYTITNSTWVDTGNEKPKKDGTLCDDGAFCTVNDKCATGVCGGAPKDCSLTNECAIGFCDEELDKCDLTYEEEGTLCGSARDCSDNGCDGCFAEFFTPDGHDECDGSGTCIAYVCEMTSRVCRDDDATDGLNDLKCGSECDQNEDCKTKCVGDTYYSAGFCDLLTTCFCQYETEDCNQHDGWYDTDKETEWISSDICGEKEQKEQEYRDYTCSELSDNGCAYNVTDHQMVDTGEIRPKNNGTACDDGLFCTVDDVCTDGTCGGAPRDCSAFCLSNVSSCTSQQDDNPFTFDFREPFDSYCDEELDICPSGDNTVTHTCSIDLCGAECEDSQVGIDNQCGPKTDLGECEYGTRSRECTEGCTWDVWTECIGAVYPEEEICDGLDNDCDGIVDNGMRIACDSDADCGESQCIEGTFKLNQCLNPGTCFAQCQTTDVITDNDMDGYDTECDGDCNDECADAYPGAQELPDSTDQNCRNDAPIQIMDLPDLAWPEDTTKTIDLSPYFMDTDGDSLVFQIISPADHIEESIISSSLVLVPDTDWNGMSAIRISASDGEFEIDGNPMELEVTPVNDAPVLDPISNIIVAEGELAEINPSASDTEGDSLTFHFTSPLNASGEWQTNYSSSGIYHVTVSVDDGNGGTDSQDVLIQVTEFGNHAPELDHIEDVVVTEGELVKLSPSASDIDGDSLVYNFTSPLNSSGAWQTNYTDSGEYDVVITVNDGHGGTDTQAVHITVLESGNHCPELAPVKDITVTEGQLVIVALPGAIDLDGDSLTYHFTSPLGEDGRWQTTFSSSGIYNTSLGVSDGTCEDVEAFRITVLESGNHAPVLQDLPDITITEGEKVSVGPVASDPDGDVVTFSFSLPLNSIGEWQTDFRSQGVYTIIVSASDGHGGTAQDSFKLTVLDWGNHDPVLQPIADITVTEGELVIVTPAATDIDGDSLSYTFSQPLNSSGKWKTNYTNAGTYPASVTVRDARGATASQSFTIYVLESGNHAPVIEPIDDISVIEGELVEVFPKVCDPDGDPVTITYSGVLGPDGTWQTRKDYHIGEYDACVQATDGTASSERCFRIYVLETPYGALMVDTIAMPETARPGETIMVLITTTNAGTKDLKGLRDRAFMDELGVYATSSRYDLKIGKRATQRIYIEIPEDARPGQTYDIRFSISNDVIRRVKYRPITIVR